MRDIVSVESTGDYDVRTGILTETTTYYYSDGTSYSETRTVYTHQSGWAVNGNS